MSGAWVPKGEDRSIWAHKDARFGKIGLAIGNAMLRCELPNPWASDVPAIAPIGVDVAPVPGERIADLRALLVQSAYLFDDAATAAAITSSGPSGNPKIMLEGKVKDFPDLPDGIAAPDATVAILTRPPPGSMSTLHDSTTNAIIAIADAWGAVATELYLEVPGRDSTATWGAWTVARFTTNGGGTPQPWPSYVLPEAGILGIDDLVIVGGLIVLAYIAGVASDWNKSSALAKEQTQQVITLAGMATEVVQKHVDADRATGTITPLSPAEQVLVDKLDATTKAVAAKDPAPPSGVLDQLGKFVTIVIVGGVLYVVAKNWRGKENGVVAG